MDLERVLGALVGVGDWLLMTGASFLPDGRAQDCIADNEVHFFKVGHRSV